MNNDLATALQSMLRLAPDDLHTMLETAQALLRRNGDTMGTQPVASSTASGFGRGPKRPSHDNPVSPSWLAPVEDQSAVEVDPDLFRSRAFGRRFSPQTRVAAYVAQSYGSAALAQRLGSTIYKHGLTMRADIGERMDELSRSGYGAVYLGGELVTEAGYDHWSPADLPLLDPRPSGSPVRAGRQCLEFIMPEGISISSLDEAFREAMLPQALDTYIASPVGQAACARRNLDPRSFKRFTARKRDGQTVLEAARELSILRPRRDGSRIAAIIERIIATVVMAQRP